MLKLKINNCPELIYTAQILLSEFLGIEFTLETVQNNEYSCIELENGGKIVLRDSFFSKYEYSGRYLSANAVPQTVQWFDCKFSNESVPVIFGGPKIEVDDRKIICDLDIFSSAFFMLSRWEEAVADSKDNHERFPAKESLAYKEGFLNKPVVNQYAEMIWNMMIHLGYEGKRKEWLKQHSFLFTSYPKCIIIFQIISAY